MQEQESRARRGRLKIFFGASPGVGKTFTMLEAAQAARRQGLDIVIGVVETHGRSETALLAEGLEALPRQRLEYRGTTLEEFDLDGALARRPALLLVDELAHTNAPGSRHAKRWQDVEELLTAGVNVWSTLNVQHVESLNDVVAQITGVRVRETVPDSILERADEVEMVDLTPDELLQRLREGKVYLPEQASRAVDQFFRKGNLIALREMALRRTAERVDAQMRGYMAEQGIRETWATTERLLVCVGPGAHGARLVRAGRRMAEDLGAPWTVVHVETPGSSGLGADVSQALALAEQLGAEVAMLSGLDPVEEVLAYARSHNATRVVVAPPRRRPWGGRRSMVDRLVRTSGGIDVQVVTGDEPAPGPRRAPPPAETTRWVPRDWLESVLVPAAITTAALLVPRGSLATIDAAMLYLVGVVFVSARHARGPSVLTSVVSIACFDFFFVPPYFTFAVGDVRYTLTFGVMLAVALVMGTLTGRIRGQAQSARERERRTATLYAFSRDLATARQRPDLARVTLRHLHGLFGGSVSLLLPEEDGRLILVAELPPGHGSEKELSVARWVFDRGQPAGLGTATLPASEMLYVPMDVSGHRLGVIGVRPDPADRFADPGQRQLLETIVGQAALALERTSLADAARRAHLEAEAEKLRTSLLSSLSHDMRTPLGAIQGAASTLLSGAVVTVPESTRRDLAQTILEESRRMDRLVANLLDMIRLETGAMQVEREWHVLEDIVGVALIRLQERLRDHPVSTDLPADLPLVQVDEVLLEQVFVNLLENAAKHTPPGTPVEIGARERDGSVEVWVADRGPGLEPGSEARVFEKFQRGEGAAAGVGLGLTIVRGIVRAHRGEIRAEQRPGGGAVFRFTLPITGSPPVVPIEETG